MRRASCSPANGTRSKRVTRSDVDRESDVAFAAFRARVQRVCCVLPSRSCKVMRGTKGAYSVARMLATSQPATPYVCIESDMS